MEVVWELGEATVQDVCDRLVRPAAYSTVLTMMRTLEHKGVLAHVARHRTFVYHPQIPREEVCTSMLRDLRDRLFRGSAALLMNNLLSQHRMAPEELAELRRMLSQAELGNGTID
jgi:predicted transcriptional regulator